VRPSLTPPAWPSWATTVLTCGARGVDGLVCLDEEVPALKADQHHFLHLRSPEVCLHCHELAPFV
jgi:hypothetical protein